MAAIDVLGRGAVVGCLFLAAIPSDGHFLGPFVVVGVYRYRACVGLDTGARHIGLRHVKLRQRHTWEFVTEAAYVYLLNASVFQIDRHSVGVLGMPRIGASETRSPLHVHLAAALAGDAHAAAGGAIGRGAGLFVALIIIHRHFVVLRVIVVRAFVRHVRCHAPQRAVRLPCHGRELRHRIAVVECGTLDVFLVLYPAHVYHLYFFITIIKNINSIIRLFYVYHHIHFHNEALYTLLHCF